MSGPLLSMVGTGGNSGPAAAAMRASSWRKPSQGVTRGVNIL